MSTHDNSAVNIAIVSGTLTHAPQKFLANSKKEYTLFSLTIKRKDMLGADYIDCIAFGDNANAISQNSNKDNLIFIEGQFTTQLISKDNISYNSVKILVNKLQILTTQLENITHNDSLVELS